MKECVKDTYSKLVFEEKECCSYYLEQCEDADMFGQAVSIGYKEEELKSIPQEALMGLGSGNPLGLVELHLGQIVLDLGSGAGLDCFLAAKKVGDEGIVIGIDMTEKIVEKSCRIAKAYGYINVYFDLADIEALPLKNESIDVVVSNCVMNHTPNKLVALKEAYRILRPGGKIALSDMVADGYLSEYVKWGFEAWTGCPLGLIQKHEYVDLMRGAGFLNVKIIRQRSFQKLGLGNNSGEEIKCIEMSAIKKG